MNVHWLTSDRCKRITLVLTLCFLVGCRSDPAPAPAPLSPADYWSETQPIVRSATQHVRLFNKALRGFLDAKEPLTFEQFRLALARLAPEVFALGQRLVAVNPPESALESHAVLVEALDLLTLAGRKARLLTADDYHRHVAAIAVFLPEAQARLAAYSAAFPASAAATVIQQEITQLGQERIVTTTERTFLVTLGPASSTAAAQQAVGRYATRWEAEQAAAAASRLGDVFARVEVEYTYDFHSEIEQPSSGHYWRELIWIQKLDFIGSLADTAADGRFIVVASRDGAVQGWQGDGKYRWHKDLDAALVSLDVAAQGNRAVLAGYESFLLSLSDAAVLWKSVIPNEGDLLTQALISADGNHVTLRSEPPDGAGAVHALDVREQLWSTAAAEYVGARAVSLTPDGSTVAIASAKNGVDCLASEPGRSPVATSDRGRVNCLILVQVSPFKRLQRFALPSVPERVALTATASHAAILSGQEVLFYRLPDESLLWRQRVPGKLMAMTPDGQLLVTAGRGGLLAISRTGEQLWRREDVQVAELAVSRQYVVARTDRERLDVYALDGTPLGPVYTPGRLLAFALAPESSLLVATDDQQNMIAWQLPRSP